MILPAVAKNSARRPAPERRSAPPVTTPQGVAAEIALLLDPATLDPSADFRDRANFLTLADKTSGIALRLLADSTGAEEAFLFQRRQKEKGFALLAGSRAGGEKARLLKPIAEKAAQRGTPFFSNRPRIPVGVGKTRGFLALPVATGGRVSTVAILPGKRSTAFSPTPRFTANDVLIAAPLSLQASIGVRSAQLGLALKDTQLDTIMCLAKAVELRDRETGEHISRITDYATIIACALELPDEEIQQLRYAVPLHDIGKIGIPDSILLKPGRFTPDERKVMEIHSETGARMLAHSNSVILQASAIVAHCHHERFDGRGYPRRLAGADIPLYGRITAVADVFDALCSRRCYKEALPVPEAVRVLEQEAGASFDPHLVEIFLKNSWKN